MKQRQPNRGGEYVRGSTDLASKSTRVADFGDNLSGFTDFENSEDCGSTMDFDPDSGL